MPSVTGVHEMVFGHPICVASVFGGHVDVEGHPSPNVCGVQVEVFGQPNPVFGAAAFISLDGHVASSVGGVHPVWIWVTGVHEIVSGHPSCVAALFGVQVDVPGQPNAEVCGGQIVAALQVWNAVGQGCCDRIVLV